MPKYYANYLWKRQKDSTSFAVLIKILRYATYPKLKSIRKSVFEELPLIIDRLNDDLPVPLVIIRSSLFQNPTHNHQVLVTGYEVWEHTVDLFLYDPNHPNDHPLLIVKKRPELSIEQSSDEPVRGFFINSYSYKFSFE